ncbi:class I SAM-dependent methyltransferase [Caballeronia sordidicola]|jgi:2-polyprenyl-3-methyl-5-hydroxy-6-metoxy-1,4-benzoquinol methylase|uniref:class I SAM-dependent methyltransferase n=1 Tax=Caballeronia sordidicola TaxID=196367 RepID=UPI000B774251|nr:class I SAM-dependent methyltransferase [Caballeronia sordidicola]
MSFPRKVSAETLDHLNENDPRAMRSRRDLQRVHQVMGTRSIVCNGLNELVPHFSPGRLRVLELGAGDGTLMLSVARALGPDWTAIDLTLLDRQKLVEPKTVEAYEKANWKVDIEVGDVTDWIRNNVRAQREQEPDRWDLIVVNLFLHHFEGANLANLLDAIAGSSSRFFACEPHRSYFALTGSHLIGALGANAVTREDAVLSVHAGFRGAEITKLWQQTGRQWKVSEYSAGLFSHCFSAHRL